MSLMFRALLLPAACLALARPASAQWSATGTEAAPLRQSWGTTVPTASPAEAVVAPNASATATVRADPTLGLTASTVNLTGSTAGSMAFVPTFPAANYSVVADAAQPWTILVSAIAATWTGPVGTKSTADLYIQHNNPATTANPTATMTFATFVNGTGSVSGAGTTRIGLGVQWRGEPAGTYGMTLRFKITSP